MFFLRSTAAASVVGSREPRRMAVEQPERVAGLDSAAPGKRPACPAPRGLRAGVAARTRCRRRKRASAAAPKDFNLEKVERPAPAIPGRYPVGDFFDFRKSG